MLHSFVIAHSFLLCLSLAFHRKERIINVMELHKDAIQLLLWVLAHGFKFWVVAVVFSFVSV